jgi:hypothetical protein
MHVFPTGWLITLFWNFVKPFLDPITVAKVRHWHCPFGPILYIVHPASCASLHPRSTHYVSNQITTYRLLSNTLESLRSIFFAAMETPWMNCIF